VAETQARPAWLFDEVANAGRENLDADHVARYDRKEDGQAEAEVRLLQGLGMNSASTVLDMGAGTGQFSLAAASVCRRVIAVDISPVMLTHLNGQIEARGLTNVDCVHAGFLTYEHAGDPVDFAYSRYALHHLPDFWKALALTRLHRVLGASAVLRLSDIVYGFGPEDAPARLEAWCSTGGTSIGTAWIRGELEEHVRDEHSTFTWLLEPMIIRAGFSIEAASYSDDRLIARYVLRTSQRGT
jgi:SAM-dependent methyltransferase